MIEEIRNFLEWGGGTLGWDHQVGCRGFSGRSFDTCGCFLLGLSSSRFRGCRRFGVGLPRPGCLPGGGEALNPPPGSVLGLPVDTKVFFQRDARAIPET